MRKFLKYVINENDVPILFGQDLTHSQIIVNAKSAGFLSIRYLSKERKYIVKCFGESTSLNLKPNIQLDEKIIENFFNG